MYNFEMHGVHKQIDHQRLKLRRIDLLEHKGIDSNVGRFLALTASDV